MLELLNSVIKKLDNLNQAQLDALRAKSTPAVYGFFNRNRRNFFKVGISLGGVSLMAMNLAIYFTLGSGAGNKNAAINFPAVLGFSTGLAVTLAPIVSDACGFRLFPNLCQNIEDGRQGNAANIKINDLNMSIQQKLIAVLLSAREYQNQKSTQSSNTSANSVSVNSQMPLATVITELKALLTDINNPTIKIDPLKKDALLEHCKTLLDALSPKVSYEETPLLDVVTKTPGLRQ